MGELSVSSALCNNNDCRDRRTYVLKFTAEVETNASASTVGSHQSVRKQGLFRSLAE